MPRPQLRLAPGFQVGWNAEAAVAAGTSLSSWLECRGRSCGWHQPVKLVGVSRPQLSRAPGCEVGGSAEAAVAVGTILHTHNERIAPG